MKKFKPFIRPIILLSLGITLMILFKDKYIELFSPKKEEKDFIIEFTKDYEYKDGDFLHNINEEIDSYIIIKNNKELNNFKVFSKDNIEFTKDKILTGENNVLMINSKHYNSTIEFSINEKVYNITTKKKQNNLEIIVNEKQE